MPSAAPPPLRILIVADAPADAVQIRQALKQAGLDFVARCISGAPDPTRASDGFAPNVVLLGVKCAGDDGSLTALRTLYPEAPVIAVARPLGDEAAVELLKGGAADYVLKDNLRRLVPAIERAVSLQRDRRDRRAADRALHDSEERFKQVAAAARDAIIVIDPADTILYWNPAAEQLLGYRSSEALGRKLHALIVPERYRSAAAKGLATFAETGEGPFIDSIVELSALRKDGAEIPIELSLGAVLVGTDRRVIGVIRDIADRLQAQRQLQASEERFRLLFEEAPNAILLYDLQRDRCLSCNKAAERLFGCRCEEIRNRSLQRFFAADAGAAAAAPSFAEHCHQMLSRDPAIHEHRIRRADGAVRLCEVTIVRLPADEGHLLRLSFVDVTERQAGEDALRRLNRALRTLSAGTQTMVHAAAEDELLREMCRVIVETGGFRMAWIGFVQRDPAKTVTPAAWAGDGAAAFLEKVQITWADEPRGRGPTGRAIRSGQPQVTVNFAADRTMAPWQEIAAKAGLASSVALPLVDPTGVYAVLNIYAPEADAFDAEAQALLQELADDLSYAIQVLRDRGRLAALEKRWNASLEATIDAIARAVEMRDPYTAGHQERVAQLAAAIGRQLGMPGDDIRGLHLAALIHDVGKITTPAEILNKPGTLTETEFALIKAHAKLGYDIVEGIDFPWPIAQMLLQHHERLDGSGYPQGLRADAILREARILAVADVVEAMVSHRPYRPALGLDAALTEIENGMGRRFDPDVVAACVSLFRDKGFAFDTLSPAALRAA